MYSFFSDKVQKSTLFVIFSVVEALVVYGIYITVSNVFYHKLSKLPGPKAAAASSYYKAYIEGVRGISWHKHLAKLHDQYGPIVRVGPNELHFSEPKAYHDIYNNSNRWDKEETLYHSFGEDRSSFGFLTYQEAKERKDVLNKSFSPRAVLDAQGLIQSKIDDLCAVFANLSETQNLANISRAYRCMTMDIITTYCFGTSIDAIHAENFAAPIITAMDASLGASIWFRHSSLYRTIVLNCPRSISRVISPLTAGLLDLQEILENQITKITNNTEEGLAQLSHRQTIYHSLLDPKNYKTGSKAQMPDATSLYEEAQALMFQGADTVGNTLMVLTYYLLLPENATHLSALQTELKQNQRNPSSPPPSPSKLEHLPILNATIKEALRLSSGVISGLPRLTPSPAGATISNTPIPADTIVSIGSTFVHYNEIIFPDPYKFNPGRWLPRSGDGNTAPKSPTPDLEQYLVPFSRGPRSCLGVNLAWMELRLTTASVFRRFTSMELAKTAPKELVFRDTFLPSFTSDQIYVRMKKVEK